MIAEFDQADVPQLNPTYTRLAGIRFLVLYANRFIFYLKVDKKPTPSQQKSPQTQLLWTV
jgi:hypothetical protein